MTAKPNEKLLNSFKEEFNFDEGNKLFEKQGDKTSLLAYDKEKSFYDNIGCEEKSGQFNVNKQRELDTITFGKDNINS
jgi:hypothetical protein